jgi:hypothetical protein
MNKLIFLLTLTLISCYSNQSTIISNESWLGPQQFQPSQLGPFPISVNQSMLNKYKIGIVVVEGEKLKKNTLKLNSTRNPIVTFKDDQIIEINKFIVDPKKSYLFGYIFLTESGGRRIYNLDVEITDGNLKGAIIHLRKGNVQLHTREPCFAIYEIPKNLKIKHKKLKFKVLKFDFK